MIYDDECGYYVVICVIGRSDLIDLTMPEEDQLQKAIALSLEHAVSSVVWSQYT
jgi:hypothetical protein